jgi:transcriptional regulator with XRE-family HTH domain
MTLGQKIKEARLAKKMTQKEVVGDYITRNMLSKIENDSATPSVKTLEYLAGVLGLPAGYFMNDAAAGDEVTPEAVGQARFAFREERYEDCLEALEPISTDSCGYGEEVDLLRARAAVSLGKLCLQNGKADRARTYLKQALDYNDRTMYRSVAFRSEVLLLLAKCCVELDDEGFEAAMADYRQSVKDQGLDEFYRLTLAQYHLNRGDIEQAKQEMAQMPEVSPEAQPEYLMLQGQLEIQNEHYQTAARQLEQAEQLAQASGSRHFISGIYAMLEECYKELEDFKMAYYYASKQLQILE